MRSARECCARCGGPHNGQARHLAPRGSGARALGSPPAFAKATAGQADRARAGVPGAASPVKLVSMSEGALPVEATAPLLAEVQAT